MSLSELADEMRSCQKCLNKLSEYSVEPRPIFGGGDGYRIILIGQAPGKTEYEKNAPFQGDAGNSIKSLFSSCGLKGFDQKVYQTSVTKCFPGRRDKSSTDRVPSVSEVNNCSPFLRRQLKLLNPKLIVCLGGLSWKAYVSIREAQEPGYCSNTFSKAKPQELRVPDLVGKRFEWNGAVVLPMIHPAGSANGSRAQYPEQDRKSKDLLREEINRL